MSPELYKQICATGTDVKLNARCVCEVALHLVLGGTSLLFEIARSVLLTLCFASLFVYTGDTFEKHFENRDT
jgi:hypothetical protein